MHSTSSSKVLLLSSTHYSQAWAWAARPEKPDPAWPENLGLGPHFLARWAGLGSRNAARLLTRAGPG
jgi:hypothetical protein